MIFFFFKQKTAYEVRISDWSSDVCSSDLELLVEARIVGDVHLAVLAGKRAVAFQHHRGVVVQAGAAALEQGAHDDHAMAFGQGTQALGARARDRLGQVEFATVLVLADVRSEEHTSELQSLLRLSYGVFCLKTKNTSISHTLSIYI